MNIYLFLHANWVCPSAGESVVVVGYGGLGQACGPSLTTGILSKAISLNYQPVMIQTTCAVQAGASGGAVVRPHTGELLGKKTLQLEYHAWSVGGTWWPQKTKALFHSERETTKTTVWTFVLIYL